MSKAVATALEHSGFRSDQLNIEVTEDAVVDETAASDLQTLSDMGVQLSVDDVGTNWSSFEPFKQHAISTVKLDGSFIAGLESNHGINRLVVETVIHMAHSLGMSAIVDMRGDGKAGRDRPHLRRRRGAGVLLLEAHLGRGGARASPRDPRSRCSRGPTCSGPWSDRTIPRPWPLEALLPRGWLTRADRTRRTDRRVGVRRRSLVGRSIRWALPLPGYAAPVTNRPAALAGVVDSSVWLYTSALECP